MAKPKKKRGQPKFHGLFPDAGERERMATCIGMIAKAVGRYAPRFYNLRKDRRTVKWWRISKVGVARTIACALNLPCSITKDSYGAKSFTVTFKPGELPSQALIESVQQGLEKTGLLKPKAVPGLVPKWLGQFDTFQEWVDTAHLRLTHEDYKWRPAVCVDTLGRRCAMGKDFMRARDEGTFPVRYFIDMAAA